MPVISRKSLIRDLFIKKCVCSYGKDGIYLNERTCFWGKRSYERGKKTASINNLRDRGYLARSLLHLLKRGYVDLITIEQDMGTLNIHWISQKEIVHIAAIRKMSQWILFGHLFVFRFLKHTYFNLPVLDRNLIWFHARKYGFWHWTHKQKFSNLTWAYHDSIPLKWKVFHHFWYKLKFFFLKAINLDKAPFLHVRNPWEKFEFL